MLRLRFGVRHGPGSGSTGVGLGGLMAWGFGLKLQSEGFDRKGSFLLGL